MCLELTSKPITQHEIQILIEISLIFSNPYMNWLARIRLTLFYFFFCQRKSKVYWTTLSYKIFIRMLKWFFTFKYLQRGRRWKRKLYKVIYNFSHYFEIAANSGSSKVLVLGYILKLLTITTEKLISIIMLINFSVL